MFDTISRIRKNLDRNKKFSKSEVKESKGLLGPRKVEKEEDSNDAFAVIDRYINEIREHKESIIRGKK